MLDVVLSARRRRAPRSSFFGHTCSSVYQRFYPSLNFSLTHTINTIVLCYYFSVNISGFDPFCPKRVLSQHFFKDGVIEKRSVHVYTDTPSTITTMELCAMHVQTCENPVKIDYNHSAAIAFATRLMHKLPSVFYLPSCLDVDLSTLLHTESVTCKY